MTFNQPHIAYHTCRRKTAAKLFCFVLGFTVLISCKSNKQKSFDDRAPRVDSIIDKTAHFGRERALYNIYYVDSCTSGMKLNVPEKMKVLGHKCQSYLYYLRDTANAMIYADSMIWYSETHHPENYPTQHAYSLYSKGDVLFQEKKYTEAYNYYYLARSVAQASINTCTMGEYTYRIGMILYRQGRFKEATEMFQRAFDETSTCVMDFGKYFRLQEILNNTALSYHKSNNLDSAMLFYSKAIQFIDANKQKFDERKNWHEVAKGVIYGNQGQIMKEQQKLAEAEQLFRKSININLQKDKSGDIGDATLTYLKLADLFFLQGKMDSVSIALNNIKSIIETSGLNRQAEIEWNHQMWRLHDVKKQTNEAYKYLLLFTQKKDSAERASRTLNNIDAGQQVKIQEKQHDIDVLKKQNEMKEIYLIVVAVVIALVLIIGFLIWQSLRHSKRNLLKVQELNSQMNIQKEQLERTLALLEERNTEKDRILKVVAHDLRTPVASISMLTDLMLQDEKDAETKEMLQLMRTASDNSLSLIAEILEATTASNASLAKEKNGINSLVNESVEMMRLKAAEKKQIINVHLLDEEAAVMMNKEKIKRVLTNLITNAIKFSNAGTSIRVKATLKNSTVRIAVKDEGIGIPDNMKSKVFDVFTDARKEGTSGEKPFGLGLSICRQIIEAHGGNIWFKSELGKGTTFYIELKNE